MVGMRTRASRGGGWIGEALLQLVRGGSGGEGRGCGAIVKGMEGIGNYSIGGDLKGECITMCNTLDKL